MILNWNKAELTRQCLELARAATRLDVLWIVVDNGSVQPIGSLPGDVTVIREERNLGFAGGVNAGLRRAVAMGAEQVWLLNNDAEPLPGTLDTLVRAMEADPVVGLASPVILNSDDNDVVDWHGSLLRNGLYEYTDKAAVYRRWLEEAPDRICLTGTALLVSRRLLERIGGFDDRLFAYWEDVDISVRAGEAGFRAVVVPEAAVRHACGTAELDAENRPPYYYHLMSRNELIVLRKARAPWRARYWALRRLLRWWRKPGLSPGQRRAILRGVLDGLANRGGPPRV